MQEKINILIVEDEGIVARDLQKRLEKYGYAVTAIVPSGEAALKKIEKFKSDLVLMDIVLRGKMDGIDAAEKIHNQFNIPVIYVSAYVDKKRIQRARTTEPYGIIIKPFEDIQLQAVIDMALYRHNMEKKLKDSEERYRDLVEKSGVGILIDDKEGNITYFNNRLTEMFGYSPNEMEKITIHSLIHPSDVERVKSYHRKRLQGEISPLRYEFQGIRKDKSVIFLEVSVVLIKKEKRNIGTRSYFIDITERKIAEQKFLEYQRQLRSLASELSLVEEKERRIIANDIHDQIGHNLAIIKLKFSEIENELKQPDHIKRLQEMRELINQTIQGTRTLTFEISPTILYELGFEAAVDWLAEQFQQKHDMKIKVSDDEEFKPLENDVQIVLYKSVRELLINVLKHANTKNVNILLKRKNQKIQIDIQDRGIGFDSSKLNRGISHTGGFGLFNIGERLAQFGGDFKVKSSPGKGTQVTLLAPLKIEAL